MYRSYVCMYVCIHVCMHVCMYAYMQKKEGPHLGTPQLYMLLRKLWYVNMHVCMYRSYVCMYVCMFSCMYARMYVCIYAKEGRAASRHAATAYASTEALVCIYARMYV